MVEMTPYGCGVGTPDQNTGNESQRSPSSMIPDTFPVPDTREAGCTDQPRASDLYSGHHPRINTKEKIPKFLEPHPVIVSDGIIEPDHGCQISVVCPPLQKDTKVGKARFSMVPSPSSPLSLSPQQYTSWEEEIPQVCSKPRASVEKRIPPRTVTGAF